MRRTRKQSNLLHMLLGRIKADKEMKEELVLAATNGRSSSSYDLSVDECRILCKQLDEKLKATPRPQLAPPPQQKWKTPEDRMRKYILSKCHEMGMQKEGGKIDMVRVNALCRERGYLHKDLDEYTRTELPKLCTQVERMADDHIKKNGQC